MTMEISISPEGWESIYTNLETMAPYALFEAAVAEKLKDELPDTLYGVVPAMIDYENAIRDQLSSWSRQQIIDYCWGRVLKYRSCSNDFSEAYISEDGTHTVPIGE